jgi:hypothetical protein
MRRNAFTLVEMMVVVALTMFIIIILASAFSSGLDVFRDLKTIGDEDEGLRGVATLLRKDLSADHFEGKRRLSDGDIGSNPPREGFVAVFQGTASQNDGNLTPKSPYAIDHKLHLAVKLRGNSRDSVFIAAVPNASPLLQVQTTFFDQNVDARFQEANAATATQQFCSPWAEVAYFLVKTGTTVAPNDPNSTIGTPLFALYRAQYVVVSDNTRVNFGSLAVAVAALNQYQEVSCAGSSLNPGKLYFYSPSDLTDYTKRRFNVSGAVQVNQAGATQVLSNVVSFTVRTLQTGAPPGAPKLPTVAVGTTDFADLSIDTGTNRPPYATGLTGFSVKAIEVTIRVWDARTGLTRQVSVIQDM